MCASWRRHEVAHFLYCPTMFGRHIAVARWHHRIHLIPGWLLHRLCDRLDLALGLTAEEIGRKITEDINAQPAEVARLRQARQSARRTPPESWREDWDCPEDGVYDG